MFQKFPILLIFIYLILGSSCSDNVKKPLEGDPVYKVEEYKNRGGNVQFNVKPRVSFRDTDRGRHNIESEEVVVEDIPIEDIIEETTVEDPIEEVVEEEPEDTRDPAYIEYINNLPLNPVDNMLYIEAGSYDMVTDYEAYRETKTGGVYTAKGAEWKTVYTDGFYIDKYEVTIGQYMKFMEDSGYEPEMHPLYGEGALEDDFNYYIERKADGKPVGRIPARVRSRVFERYPYEFPASVSYDDAIAYAEFYGKRLPTEVEWEKAARGGKHRQMFTWGSLPPRSPMHADELGNFTFHFGLIASKYQPAPFVFPVGLYKEENGLYDITGNAPEWVNSDYGEFYISRGPGRGGTYWKRSDGITINTITIGSKQKTYKTYPAYRGIRCVMD
ncbi:SUMF1/EgtB/PvdO family nonheme iron enzyme [Candidatus Poribacteria bacterium]|nr:SUMF1/EgtB/PvdO family nonheme iron enzyme [Candidatus Poribacteria bacterium]